VEKWAYALNWTGSQIQVFDCFPLLCADLLTPLLVSGPWTLLGLLLMFYNMTPTAVGPRPEMDVMSPLYTGSTMVPCWPPDATMGRPGYG
jgi:hypothetical protein